MEMLLATAYNGMAYALFSGQPLTIIGSTGPVLAFTLVLYKTAQQMGLNFLPLYSWYACMIIDGEILIDW